MYDFENEYTNFMRILFSEYKSRIFVLYVFSIIGVSQNLISINVYPNEFIDNAMAGNAVVVFSKTQCPYSKAAKELLAGEYPDGPV